MRIIYSLQFGHSCILLPADFFKLKKPPQIRRGVVLIEKRHWAEPFTPATLLRGSLRLPTVREQSIVLLCVFISPPMPVFKHLERILISLRLLVAADYWFNGRSLYCSEALSDRSGWFYSCLPTISGTHCFFVAMLNTSAHSSDKHFRLVPSQP